MGRSSLKSGSPADYKPCVAKLPNERLILTAFAPGAFQAGPNLKRREEILLFRSRDGGRTWSDEENLTTTRGLLGREPYFTILSDGTGMKVTIIGAVGFVGRPVLKIKE